ncbi:hypothetical protein B0H14DRAFT_2596808 [Mycena olivaceomarginata]|nr:hypothetical protein B0H14DRAFT_2596808 [Mycena olivaceomarginata]
MLLCALSVLFSLSRVYVASGAPCDCSSLVIPVDVDVLIPKDPTDIFGGLKSNASSVRRLQATYDVYGVFYVVQFLVHGFTYTNQYWSPPVEEFRNYSYSAFSCDRGLPSLAIDWYATEAAVASQLARQLKNVSIFPGVQPFKKVIGHRTQRRFSPVEFCCPRRSLTHSPRCRFSVRGMMTRSAGVASTPTISRRAAATSSTAPTPPPSPPRMLRFDNFTKDVGSIASLLQGPISTLTTQYTGPVAKVVGSEDQLLCPGTRCEDVAALNAVEKVLWPDAKSFEVLVAQGSGHDLNLDFLAEGPFNTFVRLVEQFST